jgi:hypothetical protein
VNGVGTSGVRPVEETVEVTHNLQEKQAMKHAVVNVMAQIKVACNILLVGISNMCSNNLQLNSRA